MIAPSLSKLDSFTVWVKCYWKGDIMDYKKQVIQLKNDVTVFTTEYVPVCWVKYLQSCQSWANSSCSTVPIYKTFTNSCELKNNKAKFVFNRNWSCESIAGSSTKLADNNSTKLADNSSIKLTDAIELQLDQSINNLLVKINQNYTNKVDKVNYINTIISKLQTIEKNQPKYTNVTQYLINKLNDEISKIWVDGSSDGIDEILNIFN